MTARPQFVLPCELVREGIESWSVVQTWQDGRLETILSTDEHSRLSVVEGERMSAKGGQPGECWTTFVQLGWGNQTPRKWFPMELKFELELREGVVLPEDFEPRLEIMELCPSI